MAFHSTNLILHQLNIPLMLNFKTAGIALAAAALCASPVLASENEDKGLKEGWYFYLGGGGTVLFDSDVDWKVGGQEFNGSLNNNWGGAVEGGIGYDFGEWSTDIVYKYRWFDNDDYSFSGTRFGNFNTLANVSVGNSDWQTVLWGVYKDFQQKDSKFFAKLGPVIGVGCFNSPDVNAKYQFVRRDFTLSRKVKVKVSGKNECSFTYGAKAGLGYEIDDNLDLTFDVMWVSQTGSSTSSGSKKKRVTYSITEPVEDGVVFNPNNLIPPDTSSSTGDSIPCSEFETSVRINPSLYPTCFDPKFKDVTTTYVQDINVKSMRYNPAQGLNLMAGLRYVFGSKPDPKPVVEEVVIEEEVKPTPVRGLW